MLAITLAVLLGLNTWAYWSLLHRANRLSRIASEQAGTIHDQGRTIRGLGALATARNPAEVDKALAALRDAQTQPRTGQRGAPGPQGPPGSSGTTPTSRPTTSTTRPPPTTTTTPCVVPTLVGLACPVGR